MSSLPSVVSIESPYSNKNSAILKRNINYAILALKDATKTYGEAAYASHLLNTQYVENGEHYYIDDSATDKFGVGRENAIIMTNALRKRADKIVFYIDFGYSNGMLSASEFAEKNNIPTEERRLPDEMFKELTPDEQYPTT